MKRKLCTLVLLLFLCIVTTVSASPSAVTDKADFLTESEEVKLCEILEQIREKYNFDVSIVTEKTLSDRSAQSRADDIYDYNGYGFGENDDGILLYISANPREYAFTTHGYGLEAFNDNGLKYLEDEILPYLEDDEYYEAFLTYAELTDELLQMAAEGNPYNKTKKNFVVPLLMLLILPALIAFILTKAKESKMYTADKQNFADSYIKSGSMNIKNSRDIYLYSTVLKTKKADSDTGKHISSSGRTHGGRSGRY